MSLRPALLAASLSCLSLACSTVPYTQRKQLSLIPAGQLDAMGSQAFASMLRQAPTVQDPEVVRYVGCVAKPIVRQFKAKHGGNEDWKLAIFADPSPNAFVLPGGNIGVNAGILKVAKNDHQLAAVLGHELGHELANHAGERVSQQLLAQGGLMAAQAYLQGRASSTNQRLLLGALGLGAQVGVLLPFSRKQESEADTIGLNLMAESGYDPEASIALWQNMHAESQGKAPPEFLSTHPSSESRMAELREQIPAVKASQGGASKQMAGRADCDRPSDEKIASVMQGGGRGQVIGFGP